MPTYDYTFQVGVSFPDRVILRSVLVNDAIQRDWKLIGGYAVRCQTYAATLKGVLLCAVSPPNSMCKTSVFRVAFGPSDRLAVHLLPALFMYEKAPEAAGSSFLFCTMLLFPFNNLN